VAPALAEVHRRTGAVLEMISGAGEVPPALAGYTTRVVWDHASIERIATWDIGIMPLRDGPYERAKCGYKLLQYAASAVPAVGSPVGVNEPILASMDGLAPRTDDEWVDALCEVLGEREDRRARRGMKGLSTAHDFSYETWQDRWLDAVGW
jgi:hypothetical protein